MPSPPGALKVVVDGESVLALRGPKGAPGTPAAPPGGMIVWPVSAAPSGWLLCQGQSLLRTDYPGLFAVLGTSWGEGDTPGVTFAAPDMRLRVPIGAGTGKALGTTDGLAEADRSAKWSHAHSHGATSTVSGGISGAATGVYTTATDTNHNHAGPADHGTGTNASGTNNTRLGPGPGHGSTGLAAQANGQVHSHGIGDPWHAHGHTIAVATTTSDSAASEHPYAAVNWIIKT
jgi:microcystin-dependent protein